jgi:hypothetical protein
MGHTWRATSDCCRSVLSSKWPAIILAPESYIFLVHIMITRLLGWALLAHQHGHFAIGTSYSSMIAWLRGVESERLPVIMIKGEYIKSAKRRHGLWKAKSSIAKSYNQAHINSLGSRSRHSSSDNTYTKPLHPGSKSCILNENTTSF